MPSISTHILDISLGKPATDVRVILESLIDPLKPTLLADKTTNNDGRILPSLYNTSELTPGIYRLSYSINEYFMLTKRPCFYPSIIIYFSLTKPEENHHIPLLVSPFGYSTYRGS